MVQRGCTMLLGILNFCLLHWQWYICEVWKTWTSSYMKVLYTLQHKWQQMTIQSTLCTFQLGMKLQTPWCVVTIHIGLHYIVCLVAQPTQPCLTTNTHGTPTSFHQRVSYIRPKLGTMYLNPNTYCHFPYIFCYVNQTLINHGYLP